MLTLLKIICGVLIFGLIIFIHEFGHFIVAVLMGVKCNEFSLGMGPRLFTIHGKLTDYSLKLLPIGGSCALKGEMEDEDGADDCFVNKKPWQRFLVIFAGPAFNIVLSFIVAMILISNTGTRLSYVSEVMEGYPAQEAGIEAGDRIVRLNSRNIDLLQDMQLYLMTHENLDLDVTVLRDGQKLMYHIEPFYSEEAGKRLIGIVGSDPVMPENVFETIEYSYYELRYDVTAVFDSLYYALNGHDVRNNVMGVVGAVGVISDTVEVTYQYGLRVMLLTIAQFLLLFGTNIAVMNLIPFPALDGGRLVLIVIEMITGKKLNEKVENTVTYIGFAILMVLMLLIMFNDILRFFR